MEHLSCRFNWNLSIEKYFPIFHRSKRVPRRSFRRRGGFRRARSFVRKTVASMGPIEAKRFLFDEISLTQASATAFDAVHALGLVVCQESVNEETESNGTNVAEVPLYSKLVGMKGSISLTNLGATNRIRWLLYKRPDGESLTSTLADAFFHSSDDTPTMRELRANTLAKGIILPKADSLKATINLGRIRRSTLRRLGNLRENDAIYLLISTNTTAGSQKIHGMGTMYVRTN